MKPKYQLIADSLQKQIEDRVYLPGEMLPTEHKLCGQYQVSRQTVRQALTRLVGDGFIERRQGSGSRVLNLSLTPPPCTIAVVFTYISDYIFPNLLREVESVFSNINYSTLLYATKNLVSCERKVLQSLLSQPNLDGILIEGTKTALPNPNLDLYHRLQKRGIPLVFLNGHYHDLKSELYVLDDNYGGGYQLVNYLYKKGHTRIAGIFKNDDIQGHQRYAGYVEALRDNCLPIDDRNLFWYTTENKDLVFSEEYQWYNQLEHALSGCSAVVCYNDEIASLLVQNLCRQGYRVPHDMAVVSFDDSRYSNMSSIQITSLSHGIHNVGRIAADTLVSLLSGEPCESQIVPWVLVEKESS